MPTNTKPCTLKSRNYLLNHSIPHTPTTPPPHMPYTTNTIPLTPQMQHPIQTHGTLSQLQMNEYWTTTPNGPQHHLGSHILARMVAKEDHNTTTILIVNQWDWSNQQLPLTQHVDIHTITTIPPYAMLQPLLAPLTIFIFSKGYEG